MIIVITIIIFIIIITIIIIIIIIIIIVIISFQLVRYRNNNSYTPIMLKKVNAYMQWVQKSQYFLLFRLILY